MTEEEKKIDSAAPASEEQVVDSGEHQETQEKMVPLAALEAERRKRQELEAQNRAYQDFLLKQKEAQEQKPQDDDEWVSRREVKQEKQLTKQEILEEVFRDSNPEKIQEINTYLEQIVERKPWLAETIAKAPNRYARAYEIVQDYKHLLVQQKQNAAEAKKIVENAKKPGSPIAVGKTGTQSQSDFLLSIRGTPDFKKYRQEVMQGKR
jgi:hypothetical protein